MFIITNHDLFSNDVNVYCIVYLKFKKAMKKHIISAVTSVLIEFLKSIEAKN